MSDWDLAPERLAAVLSTQRLGRRYVFLPSCGSTNDEVASRAGLGEAEGLLVASDRQAHGRGRRGRTWHSPPGENLYFSLLLRPALAAHQVAPLALLAGAALARTLAGLGLSPRLKWPNDVLLDTPQGLRKVAGILTEMASEGGRVRHVVVGIGVNVSTRAFPTELAQRATSLAQVGDRAFERLPIVASFLAVFEPAYDDFVAQGPAGALAAWQRFALLGQACWVEAGAGRLAGVAEAVDETGALLMRTPDGRLVPVHAGEINWEQPGLQG